MVVKNVNTECCYIKLKSFYILYIVLYILYRFHTTYFITVVLATGEMRFRFLDNIVSLETAFGQTCMADSLHTQILKTCLKIYMISVKRH